MIKKIALLFAVIAFTTGIQAQMFNPVHWSYCIKKGQGNEAELIITAKIDNHYHVWSQNPGGDGSLIPTAITINKSANFELVGKTTEHGKITEEDLSKIDMGIVKYFEKKVDFIQKIKIKKDGDINFSIEYQSCNEEGCLPPQNDQFSVSTTDECEGSNNNTDESIEEGSIKKKIGEGVDSNATAAIIPSGSDSNAHLSNGDQSNTTTVYGKFGTPLSGCGEKVATLSLWRAFIYGILGGFAALFFPCTFPMIPMTISFFLKGSGDKKKGIKNALLYGFFIFIVYFLLSLPFEFLGWSGNALNDFSTNIWVNIAFFVIFSFFAFSLFGFYDISLPSSIANKVDAKSNIGSLSGIFFMAFTLAIVSFSCTGPILGLVLGNLNDTKYIMPAMSGFGIGLGIPFAVFAMFPNLLKALPKSGSWMDILKNVFGFVELAFALKFLSNADLVEQWGFLKRELFVGIWVIIALLMAFYFLGIFAFKSTYKIQRSNFTTVLAVLTFGMVGYLMTDFFGGDLNAFSGFPPPKFYSYFYKKEKHEKGEETKTHKLNGMTIYLNYDDAIAAAKIANKPVMIDFTGWACVNCRKMEEGVWKQPGVYELLNDKYIIASLYVDERIALPAEQQDSSVVLKKRMLTVGEKWTDMQIANFQQVSQPFYALIDPRTERLLNNPRGNTPEVKVYKDFLQCGWDTYKGQK